MMFDKKITKTGKERGNALFLILIAVALFAALSYAVTQSGRGSGTVDRETALIAAAQITQYPAAIRSTVTRLVITGTGPAAVRYDTTVDVGVFAPSGGNAVNQDPPGNIGTISNGGLTGAVGNDTWGYKDTSHASEGYYIAAVGTDNDTTGREHIAYLYGITETICQAALRGLGLPSALVGQSTALDFELGTAAGDGGATNPAGAVGVGGANQFHGTGMTGQPFGCIYSGDNAAPWAGGQWVYYHALVEQ